MRFENGPLVTIAIPTYNRAGSYLPAALGSALAQEYPHLEVIVADNASSDETPCLMQRVRDARLRYLRHTVNIGAHDNYNFCLNRARGDYFLLLHDDDMIDHDFVSSCMEAAGRRVRGGIIRSGIRIIDERGSVRSACANNPGAASLARYYQAWFAGKTCWYLVNTLFDTRQLREEGGFQSPYHLAEDGFAIARLARFQRIDITGIKASFRVHGGEKTFAAASPPALWGKEYLALLDLMCTLVAPEEARSVRRQGRKFFARLAYNRAALAASPAERTRAAFEVLRLFNYRCWPTHRIKALRLVQRASGSARRRAAKLLSDIVGVTRSISP